MKSRSTLGMIVLGLALAPLAGYAAEKAAEKKDGMIPRVKEISEDNTITGKIKAELAKDRPVSALGISVDTNKGVVTLSGNAKSKEEADKAAAIAKSTAGASSVKNEIKIPSFGKK
jgi:hyperosmotically inducible periplasmic protein